jgi:transposase
MRYPDGGGLSAEGRAKREAVRMQAAEMFMRGLSSPEVARRLRVTRQAVAGWRREWKNGGARALASKGPPGSPCRLDAQKLAVLEAELRRGPAAHGWDDQRWTLARVAGLVRRLFGIGYTLRGVSNVLHRVGWSPQVPVHRALQRDETAIEAWRDEVWPQVKRAAAAKGAWIVFEDESGQGLRPPKARTWSRRGDTPTVTVSGRRSGRVSVAGLVAVRPDGSSRARLLYRLHLYHGRKSERKGLAEADFTRLLDAAHQQLRAPIVCVWDNLPGHTSKAMRDYIARRDWLTVYRLPAYASDLNPAEGIWANLKGKIANLAARSIDHLADTVAGVLKSVQYRPDLIAGFVAETGLALDPQPP